MAESSTLSCLVDGQWPSSDELIELFDYFINLSSDTNPETLTTIPPFNSSTKSYAGPDSKEASAPEFLPSDRKGCKAEQNVLIKIRDVFSQNRIGGLLIYNVRSDDVCKAIPDYMKSRLDVIAAEKDGFFKRKISTKPTRKNKKKQGKYRNAETKIKENCGMQLKYDAKKLLTNFQFDYIFLHPTLGITIIEVKGGESMKRKANANWSQAEEQPFKLGLLFYLITGQTLSSCGIPVRFVMCFKKYNFRILDFPGVETQAAHVNFDQKPNEYKFEDYWTTRKTEACTKNLFEDEYFKVFAAALVCYRGEKFFDVEENRHVCGQLICGQILMPYLQLDRDDSVKSKTCSPLIAELRELRVKFPVRTTAFGRIIIRTPEQKQVSECSDKYQLIYGPPGTGKTFILLYQAWQRAMTKQHGTIFLLTRPEFVPIIESFFIELHQAIVAERRNKKLNDNVFIGNTKGLKKKERKKFGLLIDVRGTFGMEKDKFIFKSSDDVYRDEMGTNESSKIFLKYRFNNPGSGRTVCAVTGGAAVVDKRQIDGFIKLFDFKKSKGKLLKVNQLTTVMRGSVDIVKHWKEKLRDSDSVKLGHSRDCGPVQVLLYATKQQAIGSVLKHIEELTAKRVPKNRIAVITQHDSDAEMIRRNLKEKEISSVTAIEQAHLVKREAIKQNGTIHWTTAIRDKTGSLTGNISDYIVVDAIDKVFSFEWSYVIVVPGICSDRYDSFLLLAASRAICYLKILQYDYVKVQELIDEIFSTSKNSDIKPCLEGDEWITGAYEKAIKKMELEFCGSDDDKKEHANFHRILTILRNDYVDEDFSFRDCMNRIISDSSLRSQFFQDASVRKLFIISREISYPLIENENFLTRALKIEAINHASFKQNVNKWRSELKAAAAAEQPTVFGGKRKLSYGRLKAVSEAAIFLIFGKCA